MEDQSKVEKQSLAAQLSGFAAFIVAFAIGKYSGANFLIPAVGCYAAWWM